MRTSAFTRTLGALVALALLLPWGGDILAIQMAEAAFAQCSDGADNDGDGMFDYPEDRDCSSLDDNSEGADNALFLTLSDGREEIAPGEPMIYIITLKQQRDPVMLVDVAMHVPPNSSIVSTSDDGTISHQAVQWYKVAVFKNNIRRLSVHVVANPNARPDELLVARVRAGDKSATDTTMVKNSVIPYPQNQLEVAISDRRDRVQPNETLDYVINVRNPEKNRAVVHVTAKIPKNILQVTDAPGAETYAEGIVWKNVTIQPGQALAFSFRVRVDGRVANAYPIQVVARAGNVVASDRTIVGGSGEPYALTSYITDGRNSANRGELLTYRVHIENTSGRLLTNASISASLPVHSEFVSATEGGEWDGNNVRWLGMQIAPNGTRDLSYTIRVRNDAPDGATLRATASIQGYQVSDETQVTGGDVAYGNAYTLKSGTYERNLSGGNSLQVRKSNNQTGAYAGSTVTYRVTVSNNENRELRNVVVTDTYNPSDIAITNAGAGAWEDGRIAWKVNSLRPGETRTFTYSGRLSRSLNPGESVLNTARAFHDEYAYVPTASSTVDVYPHGVLLPQTGIADFFGPLEDTTRFLTPISSAADGNALPLLLWIAVITVGLATGGTIGKKLFN